MVPDYGGRRAFVSTRPFNISTIIILLMISVIVILLIFVKPDRVLF